MDAACGLFVNIKWILPPAGTVYCYFACVDILYAGLLISIRSFSVEQYLLSLRLKMLNLLLQNIVLGYLCSLRLLAASFLSLFLFFPFVSFHSMINRMMINPLIFTGKGSAPD